MSICGLDFGTSNTTLGTMMAMCRCWLTLEAGQTTIPSAIFYEPTAASLIGRNADRGLCRRRARPPDAQPEIGARHLADRRDHAARARAHELSRRHRAIISAR